MNHHHVADGDEQKAVAGSTGSVPAARSDGARVETDHVSKAGALKDAPAGGLHGPVAPSATHEGSPAGGCLLPFMVRPRALSERPWRCGRPSFPTARRDSLSSRSDNFP